MEMSTDLFRTRGRAAKPLTAAVLRELDESDLVLLGEEKGSVPSPLKSVERAPPLLGPQLGRGHGS
jgi:hypothetical protein